MTCASLFACFQSWRDDTDAHASASYVPGAGKDDEDEEGKEKREAEQDAMKVLESSMESSKREIDILDVLQDIRFVLSLPFLRSFPRAEHPSD